MKNNLLLLRYLLLIGIFMLCSFAEAQTVSGVVSDASGPLPGASVIIKGTKNGTQTDFDGKYSLKEVTSDAVLVVSFVGYVTQEVSINGRATINIKLKESASQLNEVVVVGYTSQTRADLTGSVASVDISESIKVPVTNAAQLLEGRVSGVQVVNSGQPGTSPKITIRGFGTSNNTNPLYIIDGVQTDDASILNSIAPSDIQQMNVLKDGAASIYGARASNGVIIITTKSGGYNMSEPKISVDFYTGNSTADNLPSLLNTQQHGEMIFQSLANDGAVLTHPQYGSGASPVIPVKLLGISVNATVKPGGGTNWMKAITTSGKTQNASVSVQNGNKTGKYFMSFSYLNREGILLNTGFKRGTTRLNSEFKLKDKVRIGEHLSASFSNITNPGMGSQVDNALRSSPLIPVYDDNGNLAGTYSSAAGLGNSRSPVAGLVRGKNNHNKSFRAFGDVYLEADINDDLTFKSTISGSIEAFNGESFQSLDPEHSEPISTNTLRLFDSNNYSWTWDNTLKYNKTYGKHSVNFLVGIEALATNSDGKGVNRSGFLFETPDFYLLNNGSGATNVDYAYKQNSSLFSLFGTVNYSYEGKYLASATVRRDKSSRFIGKNKSDTFIAFSGGWQIDKESFYPQDAMISNLKLRVSYGELGNQTLPTDNPTINISSLNENLANYSFDGTSITTGAMLSQVGNPNLKWETSNSTNIGADLGFFNNDLSLSVEYFSIKTNNLITRDNSLISSTAIDAQAPLVNVGSIKNTGMDISVGYQKETNSDWSYSISGNISSYKNVVTSLISDFQVGRTNLRGGAVTRTQVGKPISSFYGRVVDGIFKSESEVTAGADQGFVTAADGVGRFRYKDLNNDGVINDEDRTFIGSPHPDFTFGFNFNTAYKSFDLSVFLSGSVGNDIYNYEKIFTDFPTFFNGNRSTRVLDSFSASNPNGSLPALSQTITNSETQPNSYFVENGSFLRLKNVQFGYTFSSDVTDKMGVDSFRFYLQGSNLLTITGYKGFDPEVISNDNLSLGIDYNTFPVSKIITLGVNIKF
ncbi:MAG: TonB-dependent receptor [Flavobacteriaceae bacterium]|nr:TonB-dependent receptor [Flavobacteriaceae bacterium]